MAEIDPITQHMIEHEAIRSAADSDSVSHLEAMMAQISAQVTADAAHAVQFKPGYPVVLNSVPPELLAGLPDEDQTAIRAQVGKPAMFVGYRYGQAEVEFKDAAGSMHTIFVAPFLLRLLGTPFE